MYSALLKIILSFCVISFSLYAGGKHPKAIPVENLLAAPDTVVVEHQKLILQTYIWRDFMPVSPPEGKLLKVTVNIVPVGKQNLPEGIDADKIWIINEDKIWAAKLSTVGASQASDNLSRLQKMADNGPKWEPGIAVTVVVQLTNKKRNSFLLKAENQVIQKTM